MNDLISFITSPVFSGGLLIVKIIFISLSFIFLILLFLGLSKTTWLRRIILQDLFEFLTYRPYGARKTAKAWAKIRRRLETGIESEYKLAVIETDSMLDDILKRMGYEGEGLGERLEKLTSAALPNIEKVWQAHKIRNNIIHDPDYKLTLEETREILDIYQKALRDLESF